MIQGKNVLVAGGTGLIGFNLTKRLVQMGCKVRASYLTHQPQAHQELYQRYDFTEMADCMEATKGMDVLFICAAQTYGARVVTENPTITIQPNLRINSNLLEAARLNKVERTLFISTSTVYQEAFYPIREEELDLNKPVFESYRGPGWMKRYIEQLALFYFKRYGMKIAIVRPTNVYGPHDKFDDQGSHVLPALIKRALKKENPFIVWGDGHTVRDFMYIDDFLEDILDVTNRYCNCDPLNIATGTAVTVRQATDIILRLCNHPVIPVFDESKPNAIPYRMVSLAKFEAIFGQRKRTPFEEGLQKTIDWYQSTQEASALNRNA